MDNFGEILKGATTKSPSKALFPELTVVVNMNKTAANLAQNSRAETSPNGGKKSSPGMESHMCDALRDTQGEQPGCAGLCDTTIPADNLEVETDEGKSIEDLCSSDESMYSDEDMTATEKELVQKETQKTKVNFGAQLCLNCGQHVANRKVNTRGSWSQVQWTGEDIVANSSSSEPAQELMERSWPGQMEPTPLTWGFILAEMMRSLKPSTCVQLMLETGVPDPCIPVDVVRKLAALDQISDQQRLVAFAFMMLCFIWSCLPILYCQSAKKICFS